jgi:hypothetical protein
MSWRARLKAALAGAPPATPFSWDDARESWAQAWRELGAASVASWEVAAADVNRALRDHPDKKALVARFSDALVPAHDALRGGERDPNTVREPLPVLRAVGPAFEVAWPKTVAHLAPVLDAHGADEAARTRLLAVGAELREALDLRAAAFAQEPDVGRAIEAWRVGAVRDAEVVLDHVRTVVASRS